MEPAAAPSQRPPPPSGPPAEAAAEQLSAHAMFDPSTAKARGSSLVGKGLKHVGKRTGLAGGRPKPPPPSYPRGPPPAQPGAQVEPEPEPELEPSLPMVLPRWSAVVGPPLASELGDDGSELALEPEELEGLELAVVNNPARTLGSTLAIVARSSSTRVPVNRVVMDINGQDVQGKSAAELLALAGVAPCSLRLTGATIADLRHRAVAAFYERSGAVDYKPNEPEQTTGLTVSVSQTVAALQQPATSVVNSLRLAASRFEKPPEPAADAAADGKRRAEVLFEWNEATGASPDDLVLAAGVVVEVISDEPGHGWLTGAHGGKQGIFPANYVK